jgi:hypothetical protein
MSSALPTWLARAPAARFTSIATVRVTIRPGTSSITYTSKPESQKATTEVVST